MKLSLVILVGRRGMDSVDRGTAAAAAAGAVAEGVAIIHSRQAGRADCVKGATAEVASTGPGFARTQNQRQPIPD